MELSFSQQDGIGVLAVSGSVDAASAPELTDELVRYIDEGTVRIVANLGGLSYTSSAGLRALLTATKHARSSGGDFRLAAATDEVRRVLTLTGFDSIIRSYDEVGDAVASFVR